MVKKDIFKKTSKDGKRFQSEMTLAMNLIFITEQIQRLEH